MKIIPANPGWGIIQGTHADAKSPEDMFVMPIVAWDIIGVEGPFADPITFEEVSAPYYIVSPDGWVFSSHEQAFESIEELWKFFKKFDK